jgi:fatty-acyl-CoA synthase
MPTHSIEWVPFPQLLLRGAARHPDRDCIVLTDARLTYAQLEERARAAARSLLALGVEPGDRVGILMANCLDYVEMLFGASLIGAVPVLYNARFKAREIAHVTTDAGVRVIVTNGIVEQHTDYVALLQQAIPGLAKMTPRGEHEAPDGAPALRSAIFLGDETRTGFIDRTAFLKLGQDIAAERVDERCRAISLEDPAVMFYTSGTTAMPKGCPLSHVVLQHAGIVGAVDRLRLRAGDVMWGPLPMFHTAFTQPLTGILHVGGTYVSMTHFNAGEALLQIERERVTAMFPAFPTITLQLLNHPRYTPDAFRHVRVMLNVGPPEELRLMQSRMPHTVQLTAFGMTECGGSAALSSPDDSLELRSNCSGFALPGDEIEVRDPDSGAVMPPGQRGEIVVRGRGVFAGYHNDPVKTAASFYPGGWFRTGDLGELDVDGRVAFRGRLKDMLKVGGENVAAVEVEGYLATHPSVNLAQVVGLPDAKYGEVPAAFIELKKGYTATEEEIIGFCRDQIASFKIPRVVRFVDAWPMGATKILKYELKARLIAELGVS